MTLIFALTVCLPLFFWACSCCEGTSQGITWRRYTTANPPALVRYWDAGNSCNPFAVTQGDGPVYTMGGNGPSSSPKQYLTGWPNSGGPPVTVPTWFDQLATPSAVSTVHVSTDGSKVLFLGTFIFQPQQVTVPIATGNDDAFQNGSGTVTLTDATDTLSSGTWAALRFEPPIPHGAALSGIQLKMVFTGGAPVGLSAAWEQTANSAALAAALDNISARVGGFASSLIPTGPDANGVYTFSPPGQFPPVFNSGWQQGNACTLLIQSFGAGGTLEMYDGNPAKAAELLYAIQRTATAVTTDSAGNILSYDASAFGPVPPGPTLPTGSNPTISFDDADAALAVAYDDGSFGGESAFPVWLQVLESGLPVPTSGTFQLAYNDLNGAQHLSSPIAWNATWDDLLTALTGMTGFEQATLTNESNPTGLNSPSGWACEIALPTWMPVLETIPATNYRNPFVVINNTNGQVIAGNSSNGTLGTLYAVGSVAGFARYDVGVVFQINVRYTGTGTFQVQWNGGSSTPIPYSASPMSAIQAAIAAGGLPCELLYYLLNPAGSQAYIWIRSQDLVSVTGWNAGAPGTFTVLNGVPGGANIIGFAYATFSRWIYPRVIGGADLGPYGSAATDGDKTYICAVQAEDAVVGTSLLRLDHDGDRDYLYAIPLATPDLAKAAAQIVVVDRQNGSVYVGGDYVKFQAPG